MDIEFLKKEFLKDWPDAIWNNQTNTWHEEHHRRSWWPYKAGYERGSLANKPDAQDVIDAKRWRKGIEDKEFGVFHNGEYIHYSRRDGTMIFGDTREEMMDKTIAHDEAIDQAITRSANTD